MNRAQRKFLSDLADLMQKHNENMSLVSCYGNIEEIRWRVSGKTFSHTHGLKPSVIRRMVDKEGEK